MATRNLISTRIALIGLPRSGKSTLGPLLAEQLGYVWLDSDQGISESSGRSPAEWIAESGMSTFREVEAQWLHKTEFPERLVLSTGGGLPCYGENMDYLLTHFCTVHLNLDLQSWLDRMHTVPAHTLCQHFRHDELEALYQQRQSVYARTNLALPPLKTPARSLSALQALLGKHFRAQH